MKAWRLAPEIVAALERQVKESDCFQTETALVEMILGVGLKVRQMPKPHKLPKSLANLKL